MDEGWRKNPWLENRTVDAVIFWCERGLPRWEQIAFSVINVPFSLVAAILNLLLKPVFAIAYGLIIPGLVLAVAFSILWLPLLGVIVGLSFVTEKAQLLRPLTFVAALPFLVLAHFLVAVTPLPPSTPSDRESLKWKWDVIESFPLSWSLLRSRSGNPEIAGEPEARED